MQNTITTITWSVPWQFPSRIFSHRTFSQRHFSSVIFSATFSQRYFLGEYFPVMYGYRILKLLRTTYSFMIRFRRCSKSCCWFWYFPPDFRILESIKFFVLKWRIKMGWRNSYFPSDNLNKMTSKIKFKHGMAGALGNFFGTRFYAIN